ncbi:MAG TPA: PaaI family thioesterase [Solirubrobacterales bacterium]|nr:PaaI family thioesterase [Solirubrobacterales bacterium]
MASEDSIKGPEGAPDAGGDEGGQSNFDLHIGTEWIKLDPDDARARIEMRDELRQPYGILHGGVYSSLIESLCSFATAAAVWEDGKIAMGQAIEVSFLRPVTKGHAEARAVARHRGRTTWVWQAEILDDDERLCAVAKMTMAVRPAPQG